MMALDPLPLTLDDNEALWQAGWLDPDLGPFASLSRQRPCRQCGSDYLPYVRSGVVVYYEAPEFVARNGRRYRHDGTPLERRYEVAAYMCRDCGLIDAHRFDGEPVWSSDGEEG